MADSPELFGKGQRALIKIEGMSCNDCEHHIKTALEEAGVNEIEASWKKGEARFTWTAGVSDSALKDAVRAAGYRPGEISVQKHTSNQKLQENTLAKSVKTENTYNKESHTDYDLIIIGAGSAAFAGAIKASEAGYHVAVVEKSTIGGTCVNIGCIPSKALLRAGEAYWQYGHHPIEGISTSTGSIDLGAVVAQKDALVADLRKAKYTDLIADYGFEVIRGAARFTDPHTIEVNGDSISARVFIIATGASPAIPPIPGLSDTDYLTSTTALDLKDVPNRLAVIGANAIGLELGQFFQHVGSSVTFIDIADRIAPFEEPEVSAVLSQVITDQGGSVYVGAQVLKVNQAKDHIDIYISVAGKQVVIPVDKVLVATGRRPNTEELDLASAGIETGVTGAIAVDSRLRTTNSRVFAAGDVTGAPQFVYVSAYEGVLAVDNALLDAGREIDLRGLPRVTFTLPQIASAGITESQARKSGRDIVVSVLPLSAVPRALVNHDTAGLVKLVADAATRQLLGASIISENAGEIIQSAVLAIRHNITVDELADTFYPYLTMAESIKLAAQSFDRDVSKLSCCAA
ncbi:MAG: mercury(II) reductase [Actinobacteria bacterium]|nr:mercury(II) reductase [Actinomycetota bacterium]